MEKNLTTINSQELINQARALSGSSGGSYVPYIPIISINNQKEEKDVEIEGKIIKAEIPAVEGFNITLKDESTNEYVLQYYQKELSAVMLRIRYSISSKNKVKPRYYSYEFDRFDDIIKIYDENKDVLVTDTYANIKKRFATGEMNSQGKPKSSFDLRIIIYLDIEGLIYRLKLNSASRSNFFDYIKTFGTNDIFTAYKTKFNLKFNDKGTIKFWYVEFEKGESVDLAKEIPMQKELQKYFAVKQIIKNNAESEIMETDQGSGYNMEEVQEGEINISQIPF